MKKYKQILAGLLAMNLAVYVMPTGVVQISASVQKQNSENTGTGETEFTGTTDSVESNSVDNGTEDGVVVQTASEDAASIDPVEDFSSDDTTDTPDVVPDNDSADIPGDTTADSNSADIADTDSDNDTADTSDPAPDNGVADIAGDTTSDNSNTDISEDSASNDTNTDIPEENLDDNVEDITAPSDSTDSVQTTPSDTTEELFLDGTQLEEEKAAASSEEDTAVQAGETENKPVLNNFSHYDSNTKTIDIEFTKELILLSNCAAEDIKDITINIKISGEIDLTTNSKITATDDISSFYSDTTAVSVEKTQKSDTDDTQVDSLNTPLNSADSTDTTEGDETSQDVNTSQNTGDADQPSANISPETEEITENVSMEEASQDNDTPSTKAVIAGQEYTFQGIGTKDVPFQGTIKGEAIPVYIDRAFFGGLSSKTQFSLGGTANLPLYWCGDGTKPMIADLYQFDDDSENGHELPVTVTKGRNITAMGSLLGIVQEAKDISNQTLVIKNAVTYTDATVKVSSSDNAGLICNTLKSGNICLNGYMFPANAYEVESTEVYDATSADVVGNAGGFIGLMEKSTTLRINSAVKIPDGSKVTASSGNAGGMVGLMQQGAKIITENNAGVTLEKMTVTGGISAGGVAGTAKDVSFTDEEMASTLAVNSATVNGNDTASNIGGFIGKYTINAENSGKTLSIPSNLKIETPVLTVKNNGLAGGYFGCLELKGKLTYTISGTDEEKKAVNPTYQNCEAEAAGAIAGKVTSDMIESTLLIQNVQATVINSSKTGIQRHGGLVGEVGTKADAKAKAYLKVSNVDVKVTNPYATDDKDIGYGFGGIAGLLAQGSILQTENTVSISTDNTDVNRGGGLVGYAEKSVINLLGTTDLSGTLYANGSGKSSKNPKTGWLVGFQDSALIYANGDGNGNGWSYIRGRESGATKQAMNDIGNYGQIIRLHSNGNSEAEKSNLSSDLITIDATRHEVSYKQDTAPTVNGDTITVGSTDAFARLSIAWNTRGYFGGVTEIKEKTTPKSKNITLTADINLTGSGITGLSRDNYDNDDTYAGSFDGGSHTITLASGETFGLKQDKSGLAQAGDDGYGEVISAGAAYHGRQGIFAEMSSATVKNLTVTGNIFVGNHGSEDMLAGGIAAELTADNSKINISEVSVKEIITADGAGGSGLMLGGFFGGSYNKSIEVNLNELKTSNIQNTAGATINISGCPDTGTNDKRIIAGGVVGELGEQSITINVDDLTVTGTVTTDAKKKAYVGGLIGAVKGEYANTDHRINISNLVFNKFNINAQTAADMCGGLFGSIWASVEVVLKTPADTEKYAVDVREATINANNAASVGGFAYRAGGKWEIQDRGINLNTFSITAKKDLGLLVCRGEQAKEQLSGGEKQIAALYLSTTKYWGNAYKISENNVSVTITDANGAFDEFVAYTTSDSWNGTVRAYVSDILKNNKNGIISIATQDVTENETTTRAGVDPSDACTTYQNRTTYGKTKHNKWSRYYYDLDQCLEDIKNDSAHGNNKNLDTPQELLVWSVYTYADDTLKKYFQFNGCIAEEGSPLKIGGDSTKVDLDMKKYSYYPVTYGAGSVNIKNADIKFYNQEIENIETASSDKKTTQGLTSVDYTQHYTMHCGLLLSYQSVNTSKTGAPLTVDNVTLSGSIGKVNNETSGVLVSESAGGYSGSKTMYSAISIKNTTLDNLKVNNCGEGYAPLLVNRISGYLNLTVNTLSTVNYTEGTPVASSLIGTVGSNTAESITMNFQNIKVPDKKADSPAKVGIFSHATLLESYAYKKDSSTSNATYIFYYKDDWNEKKEHHNNVTYGKEITNSTEFTGIQKWYYDEKLHGTDEGLVYDSADDKSGFDASDYLPYVYVSYNEANCMHEIKVNQRVENILEGCGTYGHPYRITKAAEMNILSEYLSTGLPQKDWRVRVTESQESVHTSKSVADYSSDEDVVYQYDGNGNWVQVENTATDGTENWQSVNGGKNTVSKDFMLNYLLNAYYDIQGSVIQGSDSAEKQLILNDFKGFGSENNPFRGVITSTNDTTLVLKGNRTGNGLIPYSYGSVVKNLKIAYKKSDENQGKTLTYETNTMDYPKVAFGGVIGCVMGGDNIIDGVTVEMDDAYLTLSGEKSHLLQVGGYVGSVSGGGVIFRNMTDKTGLIESKVEGLKKDSGETVENKVFNLYVNPYVGRVMDGFAFYEKTSNKKDVATALENTNKNYKINTLNAGTHLDVTDNAVTVKDAEGLLILSAIVNSGAASGGNSLAYSSLGDSMEKPITYQDTGRQKTYIFGGKYGKVRNAVYSEIGKKITDTTASSAEDQRRPGDGNLPYLIQKYGNGQTAIFSATTDVTINLSDSASDFDMTDYGNGYQGIGARYVSNAVYGNSSVENAENLVPEVKTFNGNNKIVTVNMQVSEYADDDFPTASVGGIFNVVRVSVSGTISGVTIKQKKNSTSTQDNTTLSEKTQNTAGISLAYYNFDGEKADTTCSNKKEVGLGGFAGSLVGYTNDNDNRDITVTSIQTDGLTIDSPASAGGIFGNIGKPAENKNSNIAILLQPQNSQMTYGVAFNNCSYQNLNVTGKYAAGGFSGYIGNTDQNPKSSVNGDGSENAILTRTNMGENSSISATDNSSWAGGLFGYVGTRMFVNMTENGGKKNTKAILQNVSVSAGTAVGGCIGYIKEKCYGIYNVIVKGTGTNYPTVKILDKSKEQTGTFYAGGIIGYAYGQQQGWTLNWPYVGGISGSSVENVQVNDEGKSTYYDYSGSNKIKTNYIAGGIIGQVCGGKTRIEDCIVTSDQIYGSVAGGITGQTDSQMQFVNCKTKGTSEKKAAIKGFSTAGGILGFWQNPVPITIQNCEVQYLDIEGKDWGVGALIGDADGDTNGGVGTLYLFNSSAKNSEVTAAGNKDDGGGRWPCVGSIIGNLRNKIKASNVLVSAVKLDGADGAKVNNNTTKVSKGLLFGKVNGKTVNIAGISIQNIPKDSESLELAGDNYNTTDSYIAFADYSGNALKVMESDSHTDLLDVNVSDAVLPYVVTSPKSAMSVYQDENIEKYLYGDGVNWTGTDSFSLEAKKIWDDRNNKNADGTYSYSNTGVEKFDFASTTTISTYNENQTNKAEKNFPVIQISAGDTQTVTDYLDILTNGGFSKANSANKNGETHVEATASVYEYKNNKFVQVQENNNSVMKAFKVNTAADGKITFSTTTDYDNGNDRFTLLKVTFTEKDEDKKEYKYNVFVPVLVRRMLEIDFSATLTYGTDFKKQDYEERKTHVLESFGSSVTGYLTYTYNSAAGTYTDYGWESYINAGGDVTEMKKSIKFQLENVKQLPKGMQLTLIDARSGNAYYYSATGKEDYKEGGINIPLENFMDSSGKAYEEPSISELIGAKAESGGKNPAFIKVDVTGKPESSDMNTDDKDYSDFKPTVKIKNETSGKYEYYRLANSELGESGAYSITVDENALKKETGGKVSSEITENYYLVITVPKDSESSALNGSIQTAINSEIPNQVHYQKITGVRDDHSNSASTYVLSNGYTQSLEETGNRGVSQKLSMSDSMLGVSVKDTITFPNGQIYNDNDKLYMRFVGGLQKTIKSNTSGTSTSAEQFPSGTTGTANFYVYTEENNEKTYYIYKNGSWSKSGTEEVMAVSYPWTSTGGNMELPLSADGKSAIDLQGLRTLVKGGNNNGTSTFYVEVKMDATIPGAGLDVIPESKTETDGRPEDYVKLTYYSQLSTESQSLTYSSNRTTLSTTETAYYREEPSGVELTYDADKIDQLGINLLDLQRAYLDADEQNTYIDTTATYDLSAMKNLKDTLKNSSGIKFTLTLMPKNTTESKSAEEYDSALSDARNYLSVDLRSQNSGKVDYDNNGTWFWTVPKDSYYDMSGDQITTSSVFDGSKLLQAIRLKVNVANIENVNHFYSNYKVVLTAEILDKNNTAVMNTHKDDNIIYTLAKIKPEFVQ